MSDPGSRPALRVFLLVLGLVIGGALLGARAHAEDPDVVRSLTSTDGGDGTYTVPVLNSDVPDVSVAMVPAAESGEGRDVYYMVSTTMHLSPGAPIMKSYDLVNWEIVNYVYDRLHQGDDSSLRNGRNSYGAGQWASSLRYHDGRFYVAFNTNNVGGAYVFWTDDVEDGGWHRIALGRGYHDASLFFDEADGGTPYLFHGAGSTNAVQLSDDLTTVVAEYPNITSHAAHDLPALTSAYEGQQVFWFDGYYYIPTITWPPGEGRQVVLLRSRELLGRYTSAGGEDTYEARGVLNSDGFAQGSLVPVTGADGETDWHGFFFRDTFPVGRIPGLIPATWNDGWPTFGDAGRVRLGDEFEHLVTLPDELAAAQRLKSVVASDDFANDAPRKAFNDPEWAAPGTAEQLAEAAHNGSDLDPAWQWNHNPDNRYWSLTERPGWLRLTTGHVVTGDAVYSKAPQRELAYLEEARNTLSQRTFGPRASAEIRMDVSGMLDGDVAGLAAYTRSFAYAGIKRVAGELTLGVVQRLQPFSDSFDKDAAEAFVEGSTVALGSATDVHLKADADFESRPGQLWVQFRYSLDGQHWEDLGSPAGPLTMDWSLSHFMGYRFGIFNYALDQTGGHVDVDHYLLSGTLSSEGGELDHGLLAASVAAGEALEGEALAPEQAQRLAAALQAARAVDSPSTQNQIDAPAQALAAVVAQLRADLAAEPEPTPTPEPSASPTPTPEPSAAPSAPATPPADVHVDVYSTPGFHRVNGRTWHTTCEPYSQTERCRTDIWATSVRLVDGRFVGTTGWVFNNLTYLPLLPRESWAANPLGYAGEWTSAEGRRWWTECDTANTGRGGCRSYIWSDLVVSDQGPDGRWSHRAGQDWVFNNQVRFRS